MSYSTNNFSVSISGKDKMCLLNGDLGGNLESSVDFGKLKQEVKTEKKDEETGDTITESYWEIKDIPIPEILRNLIHIYGKEPYHNIVLNDLDTYGLELLEYRYNLPLYLYKEAGNEDSDGPLYKNTLIENDDTEVQWWSEQDKTWKDGKLKEIPSENLEKLVDNLTENRSNTDIYIDG
jgi:hypothetical protein